MIQSSIPQPVLDFIQSHREHEFPKDLILLSNLDNLSDGSLPVTEFEMDLDYETIWADPDIHYPLSTEELEQMDIDSTLYLDDEMWQDEYATHRHPVRKAG